MEVIFLRLFWWILDINVQNFVRLFFKVLAAGPASEIRYFLAGIVGIEGITGIETGKELYTK